MNNGAIDELKVLIEADYSGLKVQLQQAMSHFTNFLSEVNNGQVSWVKILQGSFTPALIATIASTFALSIEQALNFQQAVQGASLNTQTSFEKTTAAMTNGAYSISSATGQSANDVETALGHVSMYYKNYNDALAVTNDLAQFATVEHMSMADAIGTVLPLLQQWNISAADASTVIATLGQSTSFGSLSVDELAKSLTGAGTSLRGLTTLPNAIAQLQEASAIPGMTPDTVLNMFAAVVSGANKTNLAVDKVFGDMGEYIKNEGLGAALTAIASKIQDLGQVKAQALASQFGLSSDTINAALQAPIEDFKKIDALAQKFLKGLEPLQQWFLDNQTTLDKFKEAWTSLVADLEVAAVPEVLKVMLKILEGADVLAKIFNEGGNGPTSQSVQAGLKSQLGSDWEAMKQGDNPLAGLAVLKDGLVEVLTLIAGKISGGGQSGVTNNNFNVAPNSAGAQKLNQGAHLIQSSGGNTGSNF